MKRVASLYLPDWPIERLAQAERIATPPERAPVDTVPLNAIAAQERHERIELGNRAPVGIEESGDARFG